MAKRDLVIPLFILVVFVTALVGLFISNTDSKPGLLGSSYLSMSLGRTVELDDIYKGKDFVVLIFFRAGAFNDTDFLDEMMDFKSSSMNLNFTIVFIGIDGEYSEYYDFLFNNSLYFNEFIWLYTPNTNYFRYIEESGEPNIYISWLESKNLRMEYVGVDPDPEKILEKLDELGFT